MCSLVRNTSTIPSHALTKIKYDGIFTIMTEMNDFYRLRDQAIDMGDFDTADKAQGQIDRALARLGLDASQASINETIPKTKTNPLEELQSAGASELTPIMIQRAINLLDPNSADAASDAEIVLGYAVFGQSQNPEDEEWANIVERAHKVYRHRVGSKNSLL